MSDTDGFIRLPHPGRRIYHGSTFEPTPRGRWYLQNHQTRVSKNPIYGPRVERLEKVMRSGVIGTIERFRIIES